MRCPSRDWISPAIVVLSIDGSLHAVQENGGLSSYILGVQFEAKAHKQAAGINAQMLGSFNAKWCGGESRVNHSEPPTAGHIPKAKRTERLAAFALE